MQDRTVLDGAPPAATPMTDLQIALSKAVDLAHALPAGSAHKAYEELVATYLCQVVAAVRAARP